jgi:hypothetical protein
MAPKAKSPHVRSHVGFQEQSRLVLLILSSSPFDPNRTSRPNASTALCLIGRERKFQSSTATLFARNGILARLFPFESPLWLWISSVPAPEGTSVGNSRSRRQAGLLRSQKLALDQLQSYAQRHSIMALSRSSLASRNFLPQCQVLEDQIASGRGYVLALTMMPYARQNKSGSTTEPE